MLSLQSLGKVEGPPQDGPSQGYVRNIVAEVFVLYVVELCPLRG